MSTLTFSLPPSDGSLSIPQVYDYHYVHNAGAPLFKYRASNGEVKTLSWATSVRAIHRVARLIQAYVENAGQRGSGSNPVVFAILASIDSFTYFALMAGIIRAGHVAFPISTRNSQLGTAHLLRESGAKYLFLSKDDVHQKLGTEAKNIVLQEGTRDITIVSPPEYAELFEKEDAHFELLSPMSKPKEQQPALILHSSGSTAFPKPITLTHRILLQWGCLPYFGETKLCGKVLSCHSLPMFHAMGAIQLMWTAMNGLIMSAFAPADPPIVPSPDRVFEDAIGTGSNFVFCVPAFVEYWSRDPSRIQKMKELSSIIFAGAPMNQAVGDMLVGQGVPLVPFYGATEIGCVVTFLPKGPAKEGWEYFTISKHCQPVFLPQETADDIFELALVDCDSHTPCVLNHKIDGKAAYATNDLLIRHPTNPNLWKIYGRADDQIMHSTGEKTNPGPLEAILCTDPLISNAVMFGRGKFHAGVIVEPVPAQRFDPSDLERLAEYRNQIWPTVEKVNAYAPTHSRIFKEMILVTNPSKPFELTPKGTPRRHVVLAAYEQEIEKAYADVAESSQIELPTPKTWDIEESVNFVRAALDNVLKEKVGDEDDIFQHGCDSLQATWIRNTILHALRESKVPTRHIPHNFVYQYPTVRKLGAFLASTAQPGASAATPSADGMKLLADKYSAQFPAHSPSVPVPNAEAVLVTGTTGRLGCHILATLLAQSSVARVFALNRKDARTQRGLEARQKIALEDQGLSPELVHHEKLSLLEGDVVSPQFGLDGAIFKAMQESVTCIIHNAWRVDFNVSLSSMEPMVAGTRNLLDFALSSKFTSPPKFLFVSSLSVYRNWTRGPAPEEPIPDPVIAQGSGYSESKWVGEKILLKAAETTPLSPSIVRVGQISGGKNGAWSTVEWFPSLVRAGEVVGCLPIVAGHVSWLPADVAGASLVEMRRSSAPILHLAHPKPVPWSTVLNPLSEKMGVPLVPYSDWLAKLEATISSHAHVAVAQATGNPALRNMDFFRGAEKTSTDPELEAMGFPRLVVEVAKREAPSLQKVTALGADDVDRWLSYWRAVGFLQKEH